MNPLLHKRFEHLKAQIESLSETLEAQRADVVRQHEEKEALLQEQWSQRKNLTALNRISRDFDTLDEQNSAYAGERQEIRESLNRLLKIAKSLRTEYGS